MHILHGYNFGGQLAFYKVFFEKDCYGFCKSVKTFNFIFGLFKVTFYGMMFCIYFNYEAFELVLWLGPCHKNIIDETQISAGFIFNERIDLSLFELGHEYVCVCRATYYSHRTALDLKVKLRVKNEIV